MQSSNVSLLTFHRHYRSTNHINGLIMYQMTVKIEVVLHEKVEIERKMRMRTNSLVTQMDVGISDELKFKFRFKKPADFLIIAPQSQFVT